MPQFSYYMYLHVSNMVLQAPDADCGKCADRLPSLSILSILVLDPKEVSFGNLSSVVPAKLRVSYDRSCETG
jgi:hypothetical protein